MSNPDSFIDEVTEEVRRDRRPEHKRRIKGQVIELALPTYYEDVSSSRIREAIEKNLEVSMLVDPLVEAYIYEHGLYIGAPLYKDVAKPQPLSIRHSGRQGRTRARSTDGAEITARTVKASELLGALGDERLADYVRQQASGRILLLENASWRNGSAETMPLLLGELERVLAALFSMEVSPSLMDCNEPDRPSLMPCSEGMERPPPRSGAALPGVPCPDPGMCM